MNDEQIKEFRNEFGQLFDEYYDREIPGSFSEGQNLEVFIDKLLRQQREKIDKILENLEYDGWIDEKGHYFYETKILDARHKIHKLGGKR